MNRQKSTQLSEERRAILATILAEFVSDNPNKFLLISDAVH